jgi:hypothetical protein
LLLPNPMPTHRYRPRSPQRWWRGYPFYLVICCRSLAVGQDKKLVAIKHFGHDMISVAGPSTVVQTERRKWAWNWG